MRIIKLGFLSDEQNIRTLKKLYLTGKKVCAKNQRFERITDRQASSPVKSESGTICVVKIIRIT